MNHAKTKVNKPMTHCLEITTVISYRIRIVSLFIAACAQNCKTCNIKGQNKCDPEQCLAGYTFNFGSNQCDGNSVSY